MTLSQEVAQSEAIFWEENQMYKPFDWKIAKIMESAKCTKEEAEDALRKVQHNMEE